MIQYLNEVRQYLQDMIQNIRASGKQKIQLPPKIISISLKDGS